MTEELTAQLIFFGRIGLVILMTIVIAAIVNRFFLRIIAKASSEMHSDPTNYKFLRRAVVAGIYIIGFGIAISMVPELRTLASSLLAGAGILAVSVGFASQQALSNIISGFFIILFKPFRVNDRLTINNLTGVVEDITLRHVVIRDLTNNRIVIPNATISQESIINSDIVEDKICKWIEIGISYDSNIKLARKIMKEEIMKHKFHIDPRTKKEKKDGVELAPVRVLELADSSVNLRAWAWANNAVEGFEMQCDLLESIKERFDAEGITIPFPQTDIHVKS